MDNVNTEDGGGSGKGDGSIILGLGSNQDRATSASAGSLTGSAHGVYGAAGGAGGAGRGDDEDCADDDDDRSSVGSDSEVNAPNGTRKTDRFGFIGGTQYTDAVDTALPMDVARQREMKWLDMLQHWDRWMPKRYQKVKLRCRKGIPPSLRARAWQYLSGGRARLALNKGKFDELDQQEADPKWVDTIEKDLHRQFPFHEMFAARGGHGQQDLFRVLKAYTVYCPEEGYCQAQAPVAAVLLMHMPAEQAFWCFVQICEKYLPGYYSPGLEGVQLDGETLSAVLKKSCTLAYRHLKKHKVDPILYMTEWFMCVFSRTLPWASVLRVWDIFFCEGVKVVFRVAISLVRNTIGSSDKLRDCQGLYETMEKLRNIPAEYMHEDRLMHEVLELEVTESQIETERQKQIGKWKEQKGSLYPASSVRRLYGTRAVHDDSKGAPVPAPSDFTPPSPSSTATIARAPLSPTGSMASIRPGKDDTRMKKKADKERERLRKEEEKNRALEEKERLKMEKKKKKRSGSEKGDRLANGHQDSKNGKAAADLGERHSLADPDMNPEVKRSTLSILSELSLEETYL